MHTLPLSLSPAGWQGVGWQGVGWYGGALALPQGERSAWPPRWSETEGWEEEEEEEPL